MEGEGEVEGDVDVHIAPVYTVAKFGILVMIILENPY